MGKGLDGPERLRGSERILASRFLPKRTPEHLVPPFCVLAHLRLAPVKTLAHPANKGCLFHRVAYSRA